MFLIFEASGESVKLPAQRTKNVSTCQRALHAYVSMCLPCLRAHMPTYLVCSGAVRAYILTCLGCLRALRVLVLTRQRVLSACVSTCLACLCTHVSRWFAILLAHVQTCLESLAWQSLRDYVITCQHALPLR